MQINNLLDGQINLNKYTLKENTSTHIQQVNPTNYLPLGQFMAFGIVGHLGLSNFKSLTTPMPSYHPIIVDLQEILKAK